MSSPVISIQNISKTFLRNQDQGTLLSAKISHWLNPFQWGKSSREVSGFFYALKDVSFDVQEGDVLGVIGRNGAGKSTLLKVISQVTRPMKGRVVVRGTLGSLLEVGTGFHWELTGRENIFLNGAIIGMSKSDIKKSFDEIVDFAGTGDFLDTQLKFYSPGMQTRLAFSVAAHLNAKILLLDETLSVGDFVFQKKCLDKIKAMSQSGRTIMLVSHNMSLVPSTCNKCALLEEGKLIHFGSPTELVRHYQSTVTTNATEYWNSDRTFRLYDFGFISDSGDLQPSVQNFKPVRLTFKVDVRRALSQVSFVIGIEDKDLRRITVLNSRIRAKWFEFQPGSYNIIVDIQDIPLALGEYNTKLHVTDEHGTVLWVDPGPAFSVEDNEESSWHMAQHPEWYGNVLLKQQWDVVDDQNL